MRQIRKKTFETNSSSTHSFAIERGSDNFERLHKIFDTILYGDRFQGIYGIDAISDEEELLKLLKLLHEAQTIIIEGTENC